VAEPVSVPRGRHAPPLEVRRERQRERLLHAAASVFARVGYAEASAEAIAREAGMSKATFYEHFGNKEAAIIALWDQAADVSISAALDAAETAPREPLARVRAGIHAFLDTLAEHPEESRTLLVEIIGAGPEAARRRDTILQRFAETLYNAQPTPGQRPFASMLDAFAVVGAIAELASRQMRLGDPSDLRDLEPVIDRLLTGLLIAD
jgi:AcrR family transcriptional regulator